MKENYQKQMEALIDSFSTRPKLLLHSCCGPCSSAVLEQLTKHFDVTIYFLNHCIYPYDEYQLRLNEQQRLLAEMPFASAVSILEAPYDHDAFLQVAKGLEAEPEGGARCTACFNQRLSRTALAAKQQGFDYFGSTLTVSPHKDAVRLNEIGRALAEEYDIPYLVSDFKKKEGYKRSITLSQAYNLYRQEYCGCEFSRRNEN